jgi:hypothetical protein
VKFNVPTVSRSNAAVAHKPITKSEYDREEDARRSQREPQDDHDGHDRPGNVGKRLANST